MDTGPGHPPAGALRIALDWRTSSRTGPAGHFCSDDPEGRRNSPIRPWPWARMTGGLARARDVVQPITLRLELRCRRPSAGMSSRRAGKGIVRRCWKSGVEPAAGDPQRLVEAFGRCGLRPRSSRRTVFSPRRAAGPRRSGAAEAPRPSRERAESLKSAASRPMPLEQPGSGSSGSWPLMARGRGGVQPWRVRAGQEPLQEILRHPALFARSRAGSSPSRRGAPTRSTSVPRGRVASTP